MLPELAECSFRIACDVTNPLCGEQGCSAIYGPQKGATPSMILQMDKWLASYAALAAQQFPKANPQQAGTGAAGLEIKDRMKLIPYEACVGLTSTIAATLLYVIAG